MKRFYLCCVILLTVILSSCFLLHQLHEYTDTLTQKIDEACELAEKEKTEDTLNKVEEINRFFEKYYIRMSLIVQSEKLNEISDSISKLHSLLQYNSEEFFSECNDIKSDIKLIYDSQYPSFHSII